MKRLSLLFLFFASISLNSFSQNFIPGKIAPELKKLQLGEVSAYSSEIDFDEPYLSPNTALKIDSLKASAYQDILIEDWNLGTNRELPQIATKQEHKYSLRIVKPNGNYTIQISEPDTTKNYTLLIKEY